VNRRTPALLPLALIGLLAAAGATASLARGLLGAPSDDTASPDQVTSLPPSTTTQLEQSSGRAGDGHVVWALDADGAPLRWDACTPIRIVLSPRDAPEGADADLREALVRLSDASGLVFEFLGTTDERPAGDRPLIVSSGGTWEWAPVLVAWSDPDVSLGLTRLDRGVALPVAVRDGHREAFVTGQVVLNARRDDLVPGFGDRSDAWGATLLHELVHLVGLDHVDDTSQLMSADPGSGPVVLGAGDLAGLARVGADAGCTDAPAPSAGRQLPPSTNTTSTTSTLD
jgi:hypothetical protein